MKGRIHLAAGIEGSCGAARTEREDRWVVLNAADVRDQTRGGATSQLPEQPQQTSAVGGRKRSPRALLLGVCTGTATMETASGFLKKLKIKMLCDSTIPLLGINLKNMKTLS